MLFGGTSKTSLPAVIDPTAAPPTQGLKEKSSRSTSIPPAPSSSTISSAAAPR